MILKTSVSFIQGPRWSSKRRFILFRDRDGPRNVGLFYLGTEMVLETSVYFIQGQRWSSKRLFILFRDRDGPRNVGLFYSGTEMVLETSVSFIQGEMVLETSVSFIQEQRWSSKRRFLLFRDRDGPRNVGFFYSSDAADCPRKFY
jgi:hypothetical protein